MIAFLRGVLRDKQPPGLVIEVNGVGYELEAPMTTFYDLPAVGDAVSLYTHLAVREDAHTLYGFSRAADRSLFRALIRVNGVGGRLALTILSGMDAQTFAHCVQAGDTASLIRLPGVGKKTAERLVVEMRDRLSQPQQPALHRLDEQVGGIEPAVNPVEEAVSALMALGYKAQEASRMVRAIDGAGGLGTEDLIRAALQATVRS